MLFECSPEASSFATCSNNQTIYGEVGDIIVFIGNSTSLSLSNATQLDYKTFSTSGATIKLYSFRLNDTYGVLRLTMYSGSEMYIKVS